MKPSVIFIAALTVAATAQPYHRHQRHAKRQSLVIDVVTDVVTATQAAAVVFVNQDGQAVSTSYQGQPATAPTTAPSSNPVPAFSYAPVTSSNTSGAPSPTTSSSESSSFAAPAPEVTQAESSSSSSGPETSSQAPASTPASSASGSGTSSWGYGLSYSPYNNDSSCKTQDQVNSDFDAFSGYGMIRIYGTDCNQASTVLNSAREKGMKLFAGVYSISDASSEVQTIIDAAQGDWGAIDTISIGNEAVNGGQASVGDVVSAVGTARSMLQAAGYTGRVVTVDTFSAILANPELCQASDFAAANCHAFFDADISADQAGNYVLGMAEKISQACGGKDTMITESGWPSDGYANGAAVPSLENQRTAISSLRDAFSDNIVLFSAFNDYWKQNNAGTFDAENYWGIYGNAPS